MSEFTSQYFLRLFNKFRMKSIHTFHACDQGNIGFKFKFRSMLSSLREKNGTKLFHGIKNKIQINLEINITNLV